MLWVVSSDIFCLFPSQHDSSLMCKMWKLNAVFLFSDFFVSVVRTHLMLSKFFRIKLSNSLFSYEFAELSRKGICSSFQLTVLLYRLSTNQIDASTKSRFILELKD